jgi:hypothetical protein
MPSSVQRSQFVTAVTQCLGVLFLLHVPSVFAHHSYSVIDNTRILEVEATIAKLEWVNPHIFLWAYVPDDSQESGYQLYAFEAGSVTMMTKAGWTRDDTSLGTITHADGTVTPGDFPALRYMEAIRAAENGDAE